MADADQELINHLRTLRMWAKGGNVPGADAAKAVGYLDAAGVFDAIDASDVTQGRTREEFRLIQSINRGADYGRYSAGPESIKPLPTPDQIRAYFDSRGLSVEVSEVQDEVIVKYTGTQDSEELGALVQRLGDEEDGRF